MHDVKRWTVILDVEHLDAVTRAYAHLHRRESDAMISMGTAYRGVRYERRQDALARESAAHALRALAQDLERIAAQRDAHPQARTSTG